MSVCRGCGAPLEWIKTAAGRSMPVDPEPVFVIEGEGRDRFITDEGRVRPSLENVYRRRQLSPQIDGGQKESLRRLTRAPEA